VCCDPSGTRDRGTFGTVVTSWEFAERYPTTADCLPSLDSLRHPERFQPTVARQPIQSSLPPPDDESIRQYGARVVASLTGFRNIDGSPVTVPTIGHRFDKVTQEYVTEVYRRLRELDKGDWSKA
jgi:hypothetical protein